MFAKIVHLVDGRVETFETQLEFNSYLMNEDLTFQDWAILPDCYVYDIYEMSELIEYVEAWEEDD